MQREIVAPHQLGIPVLPGWFVLSQKACENQCLGAKQCLSGINSLFGWRLFMKNRYSYCKKPEHILSHSGFFPRFFHVPILQKFPLYSAFWLGLVTTRLGFLQWGLGTSILGAGNKSGERCLSSVFTVHSGKQNLNMFISDCRQGIVDWMQLLITKNFNILN